MNVEELNERSHKECSNDSPDTYNCRDFIYFAAGQKKQRGSKQYTYEICYDPDILELSLFPGVDYDQGNGVIGRYAKIRSHVQC